MFNKDIQRTSRLLGHYELASLEWVDTVCCGELLFDILVLFARYEGCTG